jgi:hypothetical protein
VEVVRLFPDEYMVYMPNNHYRIVKTSKRWMYKNIGDINYTDTECVTQFEMLELINRLEA